MLDVFENIAFPLRELGIKDEELIKRLVFMKLARVGLSAQDAWLKPADFSGGMAQRVALARALVQAPELLLLDEPFGSLDALTRERMGTELLQIWQHRRKTVVMVTHSISEALLLADRVLVLTPRPGRLCLDLHVSIARPRSEETRYLAEFSALSRQVRAAIA